MPSGTTEKLTTRRETQSVQRRTAILDAALDEFVEKGFAAARMDDIARRAGVAKGTIYLNFSDKEALFEAIIRQELLPQIDRAAALPAAGGSLRDFAEITLFPLVAGIRSPRRAAVLRLLLAEAGRFPKLAEVYYRVILEPGLEAIRSLAERSVQQGNPSARLLTDFPQLMVAPLLLGVVWSGLFEDYRHLDVTGMLESYFDHVLGAPAGRAEESSAIP